MPPNRVAWWSAATSWHLAAIIANTDFAGDFLHMVTPTWTPHLLWKQTRPPPHHVGSGRRPEKMFCMKLPNTLYASLFQRVLLILLKDSHAG